MENPCDSELNQRVVQQPLDNPPAATPASHDTARAKARRPGVNGAGRLLGLPQELLVIILTATGQEGRMECEKLRSLRPLSKAMRDAVDVATLSYEWSVSRSAYAPPVSAVSGGAPDDILTRACQSLRRALARHPNLVKLEVYFSWRAGHLQRPLDVVIESQHSSLTELSLKSQHYNGGTGRAVSLRGLDGLQSLQRLSLDSFGEVTSWEWQQLEELTHLRMLTVLGKLPRELPLVPGLTHLYLRDWEPQDWKDRSRCRLRLAPCLVSLKVLSACLVCPDPLPATLEEVVFDRVSIAPNLTALRFQLPLPAALPRLKKLWLDGFRGEVALGLLAASPGLTSVILRDVSALRTLPQLSTLPELKSLMLVDLFFLEELELQHLRSLEHLTVLSADSLRSVTFGPHNSKLERMDLSSLPVVAALPDLSPLLALRELRLSDCESIRASPDLSAVHNLTQLTLDRLNVECLPALDSVAKLEALKVNDCPNVGVLPPLGSLECLKELDLRGLSSLASVPDFSLQLPSLTRLRIERCVRLKSLVLKGSTTLEVLWFAECKSLSQVHLGPLSAFPSLISFEIQKCPLLKHWVESLVPKPSVFQYG